MKYLHSTTRNDKKSDNQILENKTDSPQLPYGYPTSIILSLFPPLWFKIMNPIINLKN